MIGSTSCPTSPGSTRSISGSQEVEQNRRAPARLLHVGWRPHLCRPRWHGHAGRRIGAPIRPAPAASGRANPVVGSTAARWPVRIAAGAASGALGTTGDGRCGLLRRNDAGRVAAARQLFGQAPVQAGVGCDPVEAVAYKINSSHRLYSAATFFDAAPFRVCDQGRAP
jgi:hypothetical protein